MMYVQSSLFTAIAATAMSCTIVMPAFARPTTPVEQAAVSAVNVRPMSHAAVQTNTYAVKVYSQQDRLYMDVFNRQTGAMMLERVPVMAASSAQGMRYTYQANGMQYQLTVSPQDRSELAIRQGDRVVAQEYGF